jgi:hypothetical protein
MKVSLPRGRLRYYEFLPLFPCQLLCASGGCSVRQIRPLAVSILMNDILIAEILLILDMWTGPLAVSIVMIDCLIAEILLILEAFILMLNVPSKGPY